MKTLPLLLTISLGAGSAAAGSPSPVKPMVTRCEPVTGSRIARPPNAQGRCQSQALVTRRYDREDLRQTGELDAGEALSRIDPTFSSRGAAGAYGNTP